jgi:FtsP/CotA-like multicopper oxidase with cupredoxin domain
MKKQLYAKCSFVLVVFFLTTAPLFSQISGPGSVCEGSVGIAYTAPAGMTTFAWAISGGGIIMSPPDASTVTVDWILAGDWVLSVSDGVLPAIQLAVTVSPPFATITGPVDPVSQMPATLKSGATPGQIYTTEAGMTGYTWSLSPGGSIVAGSTTNQITVDWTNVTSQQSVTVSYTDPSGCVSPQPTTLVINYFPFAGPLDPINIPQFVDPLPHFAAGLRVNAKNGGNLIIKTVPVQQVALSTGTVLANGTIGMTPGVGVGNYAAYAISKDNGSTWGIPMWPAQTIEAKQGNQLTIQYLNGLNGLNYNHFNILADQTLMMNGYTIANPLTDPYLGEIPMVVHLHGGEIPSDADGGPNAWFTPSGQQGPGFQFNATSLVTYPNQQEAATLWYHPHDDGLTRINVYTGLAGYYFLRGEDEEVAKLPGWSGDDLVREVTPAGKTGTFNGTNAYLPEIEIGIQDRMFDVNGQLYWPVAPPNPELHPFWTPEFVGDMFVVNGKSWPYLSVAPRRYRFRMLDGCNARWLNMWLVNAVDGTPGPKITVVGAEGGLLANPVDLDPAAAVGGTLLIGPGQRADIVIDFTGYPAGTTFTLMNDAGAPFPGGDPVVPGLTDRIMQFVVNGQLVSAAAPANPGTDKSAMLNNLTNLRPVNPLIKLTDFNGNLAPGVTTDVKRQIILNEVMGTGGPAAVLVNNTYFDALLAIPGDPSAAGGPTEFMTEGTTEIIQIANVSADAHPLHIHLLQWQLVSRQLIDDVGYLQEYAKVWAANANGKPNFPAGMPYPGGAGSPLPYNTLNADNAVGGNPAFSTFLTPGIIPAQPEEMGWKDNVTVLPGQVTTFVVRVAPTDRPVNATADQLLLPFDPSLGPGYVWHCHVIDHEDMSMMRPLEILPSPLRLVLPQITVQPAPEFACAGDVITYSVTATSPKPITYNWQLSIDDGKTWTPLTDVAPYSGSATASLSITPATLPITGYKYRCILTNADGFTTSNPALLTVTNCSISGTLKYNNVTLDPLAGFTVTIGTVTPLSAVTDATGAFIINGVTSGVWPVTVTTAMLPGGVNSTDAGTVNAWVAAPSIIPNVKFMSGDVDNSMLIAALDAQGIQNNFVNATAFARGPWVFWDAIGSGTVNPLPFTVAVNRESVTGFDILGMSTGDFNSSFKPNVAGGLPNVSLTSSGTTLTVAADMPFTLPINSTAALTGVGAISLVLNVPANLVNVQGVSVPGSGVPATFKVKGSVLTIGWNSLIPVNVAPGQPLVNLTLVPKTTFTTADILTITLGTNPLSELADATMTPVANPQLTVDNVIESAAPVNNPALTIVSVFPNPAPATGPITITYTLAGLAEPVTMVIINSKGVVMTTVVNNTVLDGTPVTASLTGWAKGQYIIRLTQTVAGTNYVATAKFMVK